MPLPAGLSIVAMFIIFGTLIVRAVRPLAKDHQELVSVEPEEAWQRSVRRAGVLATTCQLEKGVFCIRQVCFVQPPSFPEQHARHAQLDLSLGLFVSRQFQFAQSEAFQRVPMLRLG